MTRQNQQDLESTLLVYTSRDGKMRTISTLVQEHPDETFSSYHDGSAFGRRVRFQVEKVLSMGHLEVAIRRQVKEQGIHVLRVLKQGV